MDAKDLLVRPPQVISKTLPCMYAIKLLRYYQFQIPNCGMHAK